MVEDEEANEHTQLLEPRVAQLNGRRRGSRRMDEIQAEDGQSIISSHLSKGEQLLGQTAIGERLPYNDYTTIIGFMIWYESALEVFSHLHYLNESIAQNTETILRFIFKHYTILEIQACSNQIC
jgi:hypothetical protein